MLDHSQFAYFRLGLDFKFGQELHYMIKSKIIGRIATTAYTCGVLAEMVGRRPGDHVEIGTLFGATAILAALVKQKYDYPGKVYAIDPITENGYYGGVDIEAGMRPSAEIFHQNLARFGVEDQVELIDAPSRPFPNMGGFDTAFIDGDHEFPMPVYDWFAVSKRTFDYVMFDNTDRKEHHKGVMTARDVAFLHPDWELVCMLDICSVFHRRGRDY